MANSCLAICSGLNDVADCLVGNWQAEFGSVGGIRGNRSGFAGSFVCQRVDESVFKLECHDRWFWFFCLGSVKNCGDHRFDSDGAKFGGRFGLVGHADWLNRHHEDSLGNFVVD